MCGIIGIWNRQDSDISSNNLFSMLQAQKHRGPDGQGVVLWGVDKYKDYPFLWKGKDTPPVDMQIRLRLGMGHNLLSIQDAAENSRQPIVSKNQRYWLVYNGEIYNFIELRDELLLKGLIFETNSDAEVLLALWETYEAESLNMLRGMFSFLLYDTYKNTLYAVRDRFGIKPLYYARLPDNKGLSFASEIHTFFDSNLLQKSCREDALLGFLAGAVNKPDDSDTIYTDIQEIPPGNFLIVKEHEIQMKEYYRPVRLLHSEKKEIQTESQTIQELKNLFIDTVDIHLRSTREVGTCLSGGLDSTNIAYAIKRSLGENITAFKAFTIGNNQSMDSRLSEIAAGQLCIHHTNFNSPAIIQEHDIIDMIKTCEIPNHTWGPINQYYLLRNIKEESGVRVLLDGQGGDEIFSGYPWFFKLVYQNLIENGETAYAKEIETKFYQNPPLPREILDYATKIYFSKEGWISSFEGGALKALGLTKEELMRLNSINYYLNDELCWQDFYQKEIYRRELQHLLRQEDRLGMRFSIENRVPFLDHKLVECVATLPIKLLWKNGLFKYPLRNMFREIPNEIRNNVIKKGFWENHSNLTDSFRNTMVETILNSSILAPYIKDKEQIIKMEILALWRFYQIEILFGK